MNVRIHVLSHDCGRHIKTLKKKKAVCKEHHPDIFYAHRDFAVKSSPGGENRAL